MHIVVVGFNHQKAPVEIREQAAFAKAEVASLQEKLRAEPGVHEVTVLSTCNRTEIYTLSICPLAGETAARAVLSKAAAYLFVHRDREAIEHLFRVACGIDSMVLGETEILGQVRRAADAARESGASGRILSTLFQQAVHAGKRARTETKISQHAVSTASAAVALARAQAGELRGKTVMLIGTGAIAGQVADALRSDAIGKLIVASARLDRANARASEYPLPVDAITFDALASTLPDVDVVLAATSCTTPVVNAMKIGTRTSRLVIVDLGVPRNIDEDVSTLADVLRLDIDDLNQVVEANLAERRREVAPVERIVAIESNSFDSWLKTLGVQPIITTLRTRAEEIRSHELERAMRRMEDLSPREREMINALTQAIVSKLLHEPTVRLKEHATEGRGYQFAEAVRDLFHLELTQ